jgi:leucyl-tRNA---protein transferase
MTVRLLPLHDHPCHYLSGFEARTAQFIIIEPGFQTIDALLEQGYRHFGGYFFRPECSSCVRCVSIRVPVDRYTHNRSHRRVLRSHADLDVRIGVAQPSIESFHLYTDHKNRFESSFEDTFDSYAQSFYAPQEQRRTLSVYLDQREVARMHLDVTDRSVSAVYCYYDDSLPGRSLGTFAILRSLSYAIERGAAFFYLGYYISDNPSMRYKLHFYPSQILTEQSAQSAQSDRSVGTRPIFSDPLGPDGMHQAEPSFERGWIDARDENGDVVAADELYRGDRVISS